MRPGSWSHSEIATSSSAFTNVTYFFLWPVLQGGHQSAAGWAVVAGDPHSWGGTQWACLGAALPPLRLPLEGSILLGQKEPENHSCGPAAAARTSVRADREACGSIRAPGCRGNRRQHRAGRLQSSVKTARPRGDLGAGQGCRPQRWGCPPHRQVSRHPWAQAVLRRAWPDPSEVNCPPEVGHKARREALDLPSHQGSEWQGYGAVVPGTYSRGQGLAERGWWDHRASLPRDLEGPWDPEQSPGPTSLHSLIPKPACEWHQLAHCQH